MIPILSIVVQAALAIIGARLMLFRVLPHLSRIRHPSLVTDIWGPITLALPMLIMIGRLDGDVRGIGWVPIGGPMWCALIALGLALFAGGPRDEASQASPNPRTLMIWVSMALIYLLLSGAHILTVWTGQAMFAMGAVMMWLNTPDTSENPHSTDKVESHAGSGMTFALLCAIGQGIAAYIAGIEWAGISGALMLAHVTIVLAGAARIAGMQATVRLGGWTATYGLLFSLGLASLLFMLPTILGVFSSGDSTISVHVARGFGLFSFEAVGLLILGPAALLFTHLADGRRRLLGGAVLLAAACLAAWRLSGI